MKKPYSKSRDAERHLKPEMLTSTLSDAICTLVDTTTPLVRFICCPPVHDDERAAEDKTRALDRPAPNLNDPTKATISPPTPFSSHTHTHTPQKKKTNNPQIKYNRKARETGGRMHKLQPTSFSAVAIGRAQADPHRRSCINTALHGP